MCAASLLLSSNVVCLPIQEGNGFLTSSMEHPPTTKNIVTATHNPLAYLHLDFLSAAPHILALLTHSYCGWVPLTVLDQPQTYPPAQHPGQYTPAWERGKKFCIWYSISPPSHFLSNCSIAFSSQCCICMNVWNLHKSSSCRKQHSFSLQMCRCSITDSILWRIF